MKTIKTILLATFFVGLIGCNNRTRNENLDSANDENMEIHDDQEDAELATERLQTNSPLTSNSFTDNDRREMYTHLNMTQDQIDQFERMENESNQSTDQNNNQTTAQNNSQSTNQSNNQSTTQNTSQNARDAHLRSILSADQYSKYETWRDNRQNQGTQTNTNTTP